MRMTLAVLKYLLMALGMLMAALLILMAAEPADAHGWYEKYCCEEKDCGPALGASYMPDGSLSLEVTPGHSISVPPGYPVRPSLDGDYHVCIMLNRVRCVYVPANS